MSIIGPTGQIDPPSSWAGSDERVLPRWEEWKAVTAPTTVVFAADSMFTPARQDAFVAARAGTRRVDLPSGTHDAHLA